ncbi:MAG: BlaI/MecI/CopY family transcriptional regulator [Actinobacteria bacterium]|nr:BlaI/MecI/CopY family transcriptional regulator [Actinomycetota bacterium]
MRKIVAGRKVGELEDAILHVLWANPEPISGRELHDSLPGGPRAYTTVATVLGRLVDKGLVEKIADGRSFRYRALGDLEQLTALAIGQLVASAGDPGAVLAHFVEGLDDPSLVDQLADALKRVRGR